LSRAKVLQLVQPDVAGCDDLAMIIRRLIDINAVQEAAQIWHAQCSDTRKGYVYDANFAKATINQDRSYFAWMFNGNSDVTQMLSRIPGSDAQTLTAQSSSAEIQSLMQQFVMVPAGNYRLSWKAVGSDGTPSSRIIASFSCSRERPAASAATYDKAAGLWRQNVTKDASCTAAWLQFWITPGTEPVVLSAIALENAT
jgi:hypothetical protein